MFFYCDSEQGSSCSTPFVSAPSSPGGSSSGGGGGGRSSKNSLYYYFSAPSSPPRTPPPPQDSSLSDKNHQRGFSFTESDFQFFDPRPKSPNPRQEMQDPGFYFSAPTSPDRNKDRFKKSGCCSYWDEMPGTPKMIFGGGGGGENPASFLNADSDFEFSSSRMSDSDSAVSMQMSSADELFFKGQILPMKVQQQLTSSDSSGSSNTMASSSSGAGSAPQSPRSGRKGGFSAAAGASPSRVKAAVIGSICGAADASPKMRSSLSPMQLLRKYQSMMLMMGKPSSGSPSDSKNSSSSSSSRSSSKRSSAIPRPARSSSKGRTLRELLHLSSVHKKNRAAPPPPPPEQDAGAAPEERPKSASDISKSEIDSPDSAAAPSDKAAAGESKKPQPQPQPQRSLVGDYSKRFNKQQQQQQQQQRRFHSLDLQQGYYSGKRLHSGSIVPEAADFPAALKMDKRLNYHPRMNPKIPAPGGSSAGMKMLGLSSDFRAGASCGSSSSSDYRFANPAAVASTLDHHQHQSRRWESGVYGGCSSSASSSRNVSPRRRKGGSVSSLHELHYKNQRVMNSEELRRKTFLPYKQGLLGCLGCATMRIAGLSKSLQPMASSR